MCTCCPLIKCEEFVLKVIAPSVLVVLQVFTWIFNNSIPVSSMKSYLQGFCGTEIVKPNSKKISYTFKFSNCTNYISIHNLFIDMLHWYKPIIAGCFDQLS